MNLKEWMSRIRRETVSGQLESGSSGRAVWEKTVRLLGLLPALIVFIVGAAVAMGVVAVVAIAVLTGEAKERV